MIHDSKFKILVIIGPTSSGKSELAVRLAKKFNGEIISCDSRQIYKGMNLGTGKVAGKWQCLPFASHPESVALNEGSEKWLVDKTRTCANNQHLLFTYKNIPHHLIDFINPKKQYSAALFQRDAKKIVTDVLARGKLPILCGGTAHWIDALVYNQQLPDVKPNAKLRKQLERLSAECLFARISRLDPKRAKTIDRFNKRHLIRALEIIIATGKAVPPLTTVHCSLPTYDTLWLGINPPQKILFAKIKNRLKYRLDQGMIKEVRRLHNQGLSYKRLESFGLEYKFVSLYLQKKLSYDEMFRQLFTAIKQFSKRQRRWWKRNKDIKWIKKPSDAIKMSKIFLLQ